MASQNEHDEMISGVEETDQTERLANSYAKIIEDIGEDPSRQVGLFSFALLSFFAFSAFCSGVAQNSHSLR